MLFLIYGYFAFILASFGVISNFLIVLFALLSFSQTVVAFPLTRIGFESDSIILIQAFFMIDFEAIETFDYFDFGGLFNANVLKAFLTK